ncbi:hypothetical protein ABZX75_03840 [Streptomyces sp. NPDC003038]|uniref:hypothetical protein n=1 Tax=unclassified Streptomyces TaxID=2593676 RepID=UPI0033AC638F
MNDPTTLAAMDDADGHEPPDTTAPGETGAEPIHTLLETVATCRPLEEVTALVALLKETGQHPNPVHEALRTAAVTRPVHEVRRLVALLGESPQEVVEADITLRAAAVGRSIEDVALLVSILANEEPEEESQEQDSAEPAASSEEPHAPHEQQDQDPDAGAAGAEAPAADARTTRRRARRAARAPRPPRTLRQTLRWPVALSLLAGAALHVPRDLTTLPSVTPGHILPLLVTLLCLGFGLLLAVRDITAVWRAGALTAVGVVALHLLGGAVHFAPLSHALGASLPWGSVVAVLCAAIGALLAGVALRPEPARQTVSDRT